MRAFWTYAAALLAALALGALLWGAAYAGLAPDWPDELRVKFIKYASLATAALALAWWARRRGVTAAALGLRGPPAAAVLRLLLAFGATLALLLPLWAGLLALGLRAPAAVDAADLARLPVYLLIALAVAGLEELYFRGLLLSRARRVAGPVAASALLYALLHLFDPAPGSGAGLWHGGLVLLRDAWPTEAAAWAAAAPRLALLALIGAGLGLLRLRYGFLTLCIGAHAAMVFSLKTFQRLTDAGAPAPPLLGADAFGGWAAAAWMALLVAWLALRAGGGRRRGFAPLP